MSEGVLGGTEERPEEKAMATDAFFGEGVEEKTQKKPKTWVRQNERSRLHQTVRWLV